MATVGWDKGCTDIEVDGEFIRAVSIAPPIISASRSTDIPGWYAEWFIERLREGYLVWVNPMNRHNVQVVDLKNVKCIVFWTKDARPIMDYLGEIDERGIGYYFQYTLNDYEKEGLEPHVPPLEQRVESFIALSKMIGPERVVWRFDPLLLSDTITIDDLVERILHLGERLHKHTETLVISFIDIDPYRGVQNNLNKPHLQHIREFTDDEKIEFAKRLTEINTNWGLQIRTCGEHLSDAVGPVFAHLKITPNACIDSKMIMTLCENDPEFMQYIGQLPTKDKGQRKECGCFPSKDIGMYNTCPHQCVYCYANHSLTTVMANFNKYRKSENAATINGETSWKKHVKRCEPTLSDFE